MAHSSRPIHPRLKPYVRLAWGHEFTGIKKDLSRELAATTGEMHLAFRIQNAGVRLFDHAGDAAGRDMGYAVVSGLRSSFYIKESPAGGATVGVQLRAGAAQALLGVPAGAIAEAHFKLEDFWGRSAVDALLNRLAETAHEQRLAVLEEALLARVRTVKGMHPAVAQAMAGAEATESIRALVERSGLSHRAFVANFRNDVGLPPKLYARVLRFRGAMDRLEREPAIAWTDLAADSGYSDQAHFIREFREFAGVTPEAWRRVNFVQDPAGGDR